MHLLYTRKLAADLDRAHLQAIDRHSSSLHSSTVADQPDLPLRASPISISAEHTSSTTL
jgi:hypothetical protein